MGFSDFYSTPDMTEQQKNMLGLQMLSGMLQGQAQASQPGPYKASPLAVLAGGMGGGVHGYTGGLGNMMTQQKISSAQSMEKMRAELMKELQAELSGKGKMSTPITPVRPPAFVPVGFKGIPNQF